ncbi:unnamed protein product, partial [Mesorhabditis spiculigera]
MTTRAVISSDSRKASPIRPFLHVGGIASLSPQMLAKYSTTINLIAGFRISAPAQMRVVHIPLDDDDSQDLSAYWATVFQIIDEERKAKGRVLLLCAMGISRSATFAIAYLMCIEKLNLHDAYKEVQRHRNIICPNIGFFKQMIELELKFYGRNTVQIIEPMPGVPVADVVWKELYDEMLESMDSKDRHLLRGLHTSASTSAIPEPCSPTDDSTLDSSGARPIRKSVSKTSVIRSSRGPREDVQQTRRRLLWKSPVAEDGRGSAGSTGQSPQSSASSLSHEDELPLAKLTLN